MTYFATIAAPISAELPCGPDLATDNEFSNFTIAAESILPRKFFEFSKANLKLDEQLKRISSLLDRSRDLRLLVIAAKFFALAGDLVAFSQTIVAMDTLLTEHWADAHPQPQDGDYMLRTNYLTSLDEMSSSVLPLQYAPLVTHPRSGPISYRTFLVADGQAQLRDKEQAVDKATIAAAFAGAQDISRVKHIFDAVSAADEALIRIRSRFQESAGYEQAPSFERLKPLMASIRQFLHDALHERDPALVGIEPAPAEEAEAAVANMPAEALAAKAGAAPVPKTSADAMLALKAAERFFSAKEPSNLAVLLLRQAQQLAGKSFVDAMHALTPALVDKVFVKIGGEPPMTLTMAQLKALAEAGGQGEPVASDAAPASQEYVVSNRIDASRVMEAAAQFFKQQEPSSPLPLLIARAMQCIDKDFMSLVRDVTKPPG